MEKVTKITKKTLDELLRIFSNHMTTGMEQIKLAALAYFCAVEIYPEAEERFKKAYPSVQCSTWNKFIRIAEGSLDHRLTFNVGVGAEMLSTCPLKVQQKYLKDSFTVAAGDGTEFLVCLDNITDHYAKQVFGKGVVRDVPSQRAWLESKRAKIELYRTKKLIQKAVPNTKVYVKNGLLYVGDMCFTRAQLLEFLQLMEKSK